MRFGLRTCSLGELALEGLRRVGYLAARRALDFQQLVERGAQVLDLVRHALPRELSPEQRRREGAIPEQQQPQTELRLSKRLVDVSSRAPRAGRIRRNPTPAITRLSRFELPDSVTTSAKRTATLRAVEDYTNKYKGEQVEVALFGGEYQEGVLTAYCSFEDVPHVELNGHILIPLQNVASLHCSSRCDAPEPDWPPRGFIEDDTGDS